MKKGLLCICVFVLFLGCSKDSEETEECGVVSLTNVTQNGSTLIFDYQSQDTFNYYEIGYDQSTSVSQVNNNDLYFNYRFTTTDVGSTSIIDDDLYGFAEYNTTLSFYIRAQCSNGELTSWEGPIVLQVEDYCEQPSNIGVSGSTVYWSYDSNQTTASYYQVEYGEQGFDLGSGTQITTNTTNTSETVMVEGNTYEFYVRAYCEDNLGYSGWSGPISAYADQDYNVCSAPSNVLHQIEYNFFGDPVGVVFQWDSNGESSFEHVLISDGYNPDDSNSVNTSDGSGWPLYNQGLTQNTPYDFYIRAVCLDGSRTEWVGPKNVIIN